MKSSTIPLQLFQAYRKNRQSPALLESHGFLTHYSQRSVLGTHPRQYLLAKKGILYLNEQPVGNANDIFQFLEMPHSSYFFPAWIGFFAYEFANHSQLPTKKTSDELPEAAFFLYDEGYRWEAGILVEQPAHPISPCQDALDPIPPVQLHCDFNKIDFLKAAHDIQEKIRSGQVYQVNLSQRFHFDRKDIDPLSIYAHLIQNNPSPFMGLIAHQDWAIISGSPERLFHYYNSKISARPIAGTRPRGKNAAHDEILQLELCHNRKERAEHAMLVDLLRNDLTKVSKAGSVHISEAYTIERYSHVMHLVSEVKSISNASLRSVFNSIFPGGTITGTPKESAMQYIAELEPFPRGAYTGSLGYISSGYGVDFNILIRSIAFGATKGFLSTGAGIVSESDPEKEYQEIQQKAQSLRHALKCASKGSPAQPSLIFSKWQPELSTARFQAVIAFVENHDSFSYNIIDYFKILGCQVLVFDHAQEPDLSSCSHIVLGPGPGKPETSGKLMQWLNLALEKNIPLLGICLGHQALGLAFGAQLIHAPRPIHGEVENIEHNQQKLFKNIESPFQATRYHSLVLTNISKILEVHAQSKDKQIMAIAHKSKPAFGVQFHPESFLSTQGLLIFKNFLEITNAKTTN
jgi:anthranilate synthase